MAVLVSLCGRFSLWSFSFVAVLVVAVLVCGRFGCTPNVTYRENVALAMQKQLPFGMVSGVGLRNGVLNGRAQLRHRANTVEHLCAAAMSWLITEGGDAACS